ncbi:MAG: DEAD/DEAH box helicase [Bacteroidetes bacterium]|nr:DEAD/DEAH box helicase [Bacteroidota bacterium]
MSHPALERFHPVVRSWFTASFGVPSPPQQQGWPSISAGNNTLIVAPTGSGKTLAAFLWCINHLVEENIAAGTVPDEPELPQTGRRRKHRGSINKRGIRVLYVSPLKALNNDIHRNLEIPLHGIMAEAERTGIAMEAIRSAVRTGDTTQTERARMLRNPPDILITTPESLYLMLSSEKSRPLFADVRYVIVDEIHSISNTKRGVHLSLTLERLEHLVRTAAASASSPYRPVTRIGLSATQRPLEQVAQFLGGMEHDGAERKPRPVTIVDAGYKKSVDLNVICAARDFAEMPMDSIWSLIFPQLLTMIREHRTTLIFVNNRRLAERVAARLNDLLTGAEDMTNNYAVPFYNRKDFPEQTAASVRDETLTVYAYHGSMSRTVREQLESDLKTGRLRALVTTSALELGIDIGTVDLVVQIQSPKGIARGLQRVGRSGHLVHANSKGRLFVTHREDLVECAVVAKGMTEHAIERTVIPQNCLDVLAQQIVAMVSIEEWNTEELYDLVRQSYCYRSLGEQSYHAVLEMLAGRFTNDAFRELRARIVWNKLHNTLSTLPGSSLLALTNAGTIPDRGYFGVYLEDMKTKVGEVDEEFIYESRSGDTFILGSNVWRMVDIDANKVVVAPAPGQPARMPFWRGEGIGRTFELGERIGAFIDTLTASDRAAQEAMLQHYPVDAHARWNILEYLEEQRASTGLVPSHRTIVVEGFRDEVGDPRIVVHSPFGKGVNGLLGIVLHHALLLRLNIDVQMLYNNDGILFRCSDAERLPLDLFDGLSTDHAQQVILESIPSSPLFGALFRQNAERSLLLPKGNPGKRRPFFLQRLRSADLLQIVRQYNDFPIVIETVRECLTDVLDLEHTIEVIGRITAGEITVHTVYHETPSPFASTVLFDFAAVYMYEWDDPKQTAQQQFASLNRELISEVVDLGAVRTVVRADAVRSVESQLQFTAPTRRARTAGELLEIFLRLGELTGPELMERIEQPAFAEELKQKGIIVPVTIGSEEYWIAAEELPLYRPISRIDDAQLSQLPEHLRTLRFEREEALHYVMLRMLRSRGTLTADAIAHRYGIGRAECEQILASVPSAANLVRGTLTAGSEEEQWGYRPNLDRIHRASLSLARKEITPATMADVTRFFLQWQRRHPDHLASTPDEMRSLLEQLQGLAVPADVWEPELLRTRMLRYDREMLRSFTQSGEFFCVGGDAGRVQWIARGEGYHFLPAAEEHLELSAHAQDILTFLKENGASFLSDLREQTTFSLATINRALSELFWQGLITSDAADEALHVKRYLKNEEPGMPAERMEIVNPRRNPLRSTAMRSVRTALKQAPGWSGRWSLVRTRSVLGPAVPDQERIRRQAEQLLLRYGVVAREIAKREENLLPWSLLAMEFQRMEMRGELRRGYFAEGLSGMQFALPEAVRMLEELRGREPRTAEIVVLNACDPANPYGIGIEHTFAPELNVRISRLPGNYLILENGRPLVWLENYGARLYCSAFSPSVSEGIRQFIQHLRTGYPDRNEIVLEYCNGQRPSESGMAESLRAIGFYRDKVQTMRYDLR